VIRDVVCLARATARLSLLKKFSSSWVRAPAETSKIEPEQAALCPSVKQNNGNEFGIEKELIVAASYQRCKEANGGLWLFLFLQILLLPSDESIIR
jgi:hypothetical protein